MANGASCVCEGAEAGAGEIEATEVTEEVFVLGEGGIEAGGDGVVLGAEVAEGGFDFGYCGCLG